MESSREKFRVMHLEPKSEHIQRQGANHSKAVGWEIESIALVDSQLTGRNCHNPAVLMIKKMQAESCGKWKACLYHEVIATLPCTDQRAGAASGLHNSMGLRECGESSEQKQNSHSVTSTEGVKGLGLFSPGKKSLRVI